MRKSEIRDLVKSYGVRPVVETFRNLIEGEELENGAKYKPVDPATFSLRALWEGFVGDVEDTLENAGGGNILIREEVNARAFNAVTRLMINSMVIKSYGEVAGIGDQLVTNMPSNTRHETIAGFTEAEELKPVNESMPYEDSGLSEKYVTSDVGKKGRLIYITEEMIMEDRTGQVVVRAQRIGRSARIDKEKTIIHGVVDKFGTVYKPSGSATALYATGHGNLAGTSGAVTGFTSPIALTDWASIDSIEQFHPLSIKDDRGVGPKEPILWMPDVLLVSLGKAAIGRRIMNATEVRQNTQSAAVTTIFSNPYAGKYTVLTSPYVGLSGVAGAADDWFLGNFKEQFFWHDVWPIQTFTMVANSQEAWLRDVVSGHKVRYLGGVFAADHRQVVKVKGA